MCCTWLVVEVAADLGGWSAMSLARSGRLGGGALMREVEPRCGRSSPDAGGRGQMREVEPRC
jgi:hypothetical protein